MTTNYFILWEQLSLTELSKIKGAHFYAIETDGVLCYLGLSYGLDLQSEVDEAIHTFKLKREKINVLTGNVVRNIHNHVNRQLVEEMLCLLVFTVKPENNVICNKSYYGREGLTIHNRGYSNIPACVVAKKPLPTLLSGLTGS